MDASIALGSNAEGSHAWNILCLDDQFFYVDPTYELGRSNGGFRFFGMSSADRAVDGYPEGETTIGVMFMKRDKDFNLSDNRFQGLREAFSVVSINQEDGAFVLSCVREDQTEFEYRVQE